MARARSSSASQAFDHEGIAVEQVLRDDGLHSARFSYTYAYMLSEEIGLLIKRAQYRHHRSLDAELAPLGITFVQWNALREIARNPRTPQRHLADLTFNSDQAFGTLCTRLENAGWITRAPGPSRALFLSLTVRGEKLRHAGQDLFARVLKGSFAALNAEEQRTLHALMTKLLITSDAVR